MAMFQAQLNTMVTWFDQWNESGQTVALFKMLTRLAPIQARFVSIALDYSLTDCTELALQEQEANNPGFVSGLLSESKEVAMTQLLLHLPLLRPGNQEAKHRYLAVVPIMLNYSMETGCFVEEARQLLAYVLIHPALREDRRTFEPWRKSLGEKIMNGSKHMSCGTAGSSSNIGSSVPGGGSCNVGTPGGGSPGIGNLGNGSCMLQSHLHSQQKNRQQRSNSLTPPFGVTPPSELCTSQDDMSVVRGKSRRFSLSDHSGGPPLSPQSQTSSGSGSETHLDDLKFPHGYNSPGMKDVQAWLKSLRLHKYSRLFSQLTYEQMLSLSEETFDSVLEQVDAGPVTQGARRKIILSIAKLRERYSNLCQLEQDVINGGNLLNAMDMLKAVLVTPIKPATSDDDTSGSSGGNRQQTTLDDIPAQFTKVLGKVCTQLMVCGRGDEEALTCFISLLDKTYHHDAFTSQQKRKISSWKLQISQQQRQMRPDPLRYPPQNVFLQPSPPIRATIPGSRFPQCVVSPTGPCPRQQVQFHRNPTSSLTTSTGSNSGISITAGSPGTNASGISTHHVQHGPVVANVCSSVVGSGISSNNAASVFHAKRPSLQDHPLLELSGDCHANVQRTQSAPNTETDPELNSRLESLCLRMTEQALGGASEM